MIVTPDDGATSEAERTTATREGQSILAEGPQNSYIELYRSELFKGCSISFDLFHELIDNWKFVFAWLMRVAGRVPSRKYVANFRQ